MSVLTASSSFLPTGQVLIYNLLSNKELQGITYIELWNNNNPIFRDALQPDDFTVSNNNLTILHMIPLNIGVTFDWMVLYGGQQQSSQYLSGLTVGVVTYASPIIKMPTEFMQVLWQLNIVT